MIVIGPTMKGAFMFNARHDEAALDTGKRILVIEDDYLLARDIERAFLSSGASVVGPYPSLDRAINAINLARVDAAVVDIHIQDGPAYPIADLLTKFGIPFLFATANPRLVPERFSSVKVHEKPLKLDALVESINALLDATTETISYSVHRMGEAWEWRVLLNDAVIARGECDTSAEARVEALLSARQLSDA